MKLLVLTVLYSILIGCTSIPYKDLNLDTTSSFVLPNKGYSGIYVYQPKTGIIGAALDVDFELVGLPIISLNTGEYGYFEVIPGDYEYKTTGGLFDQYLPVTLEPDQNYFFRAFLYQFADYAVLVRDQKEIDEVKRNILEKRYEIHSID